MHHRSHDRHPGGVCLGGEHLPPRGDLRSASGRRGWADPLPELEKRAVPILLECILVIYIISGMLREVPAAGVQQYQHLEAAQPHFTTINCDSGAAGLETKNHVTTMLPSNRIIDDSWSIKFFFCCCVMKVKLIFKYKDLQFPF